MASAAVVVLVTALVIGPLVSTADLPEYFSARGTWGYIVHNAGLYTLQHRLTGVFDNRAESCACGFGVTWRHGSFRT